MSEQTKNGKDIPIAENTNYRDRGEAEGSVIKGSVKVEKTGFGKKVVNFLFSDKIDSIASYLANYILGPSLKDLIFRMGTGALQMALFGGQGGANMPPLGYFNANYGGGRRDNIPYSNMSMQGYQGYVPPGYAQPQNVGIVQQRVGLNGISFDTKDDAWLVLDRMNREISKYQRVRVADFYTYAGITGQEDNWALQSNGWYDLTTAHPVQRTDGRWMIDFPPVQPIR